jgi:hypothetical protein
VIKCKTVNKDDTIRLIVEPTDFDALFVTVVTDSRSHIRFTDIRTESFRKYVRDSCRLMEIRR